MFTPLLLRVGIVSLDLLSSTGEVSQTSFIYCLNPLLMIVGKEETALFGVFVISVCPHSFNDSAPHCGPGRLHCERGTFGDFASEFYSFFTDQLRRGDHVGESPLERLFSSDASSGVKHQACFLNSDYSRKRISKTESWMDTKLYEVCAK